MQHINMVVILKLINSYYNHKLVYTVKQQDFIVYKNALVAKLNKNLAAVATGDFV